MSSADSRPSDQEIAEAAASWFGTWWADRPNQMISALMLAKIAVRAADGDPSARQALLDGSIEAMVGQPAPRVLSQLDTSINVFLTLAAGGLDSISQLNPDTWQQQGLEWAQRWEHLRYTA